MSISDWKKYLVEKEMVVNGQTYASLGHAVVALTQAGKDYKEIKDLTKGSDTMIRWYMKHPEDLKDAKTKTPTATPATPKTVSPVTPATPKTPKAPKADPTKQWQTKSENDPWFNKYVQEEVIDKGRVYYGSDSLGSQADFQKMVDTMNRIFVPELQNMWVVEPVSRPGNPMYQIAFKPTPLQMAGCKDKNVTEDGWVEIFTWMQNELRYRDPALGNLPGNEFYIDVDYGSSGNLGNRRVTDIVGTLFSHLKNKLELIDNQKIAGFKKRTENEAKALAKGYEEMDGKFWFGKYNGQSIDSVWQIDPLYVIWSYNNNVANPAAPRYHPSYITNKDKAFMDYVGKKYLSQFQQAEQSAVAKKVEDAKKEKESAIASLPQTTPIKDGQNKLLAKFWRESKSGTKYLFHLDKDGKMLSVQKTKALEAANLKSGDLVYVSGNLSYVRDQWVKLSGINIVKYGENLNLI